LRRSKSAGFLAIGLGFLIVIGAAVLPVSPATERLGPFHVNLRSDNCGPAGWVAFREPDTECGTTAYKRLLATTPIGLLVVALGMAMFAGGDERRGSRVDAPLRRVSSGSPARGRSRGSRRYMPG
jgi:hypothetical protein